MTSIRKFNDSGIQAFAALLESFRSSKSIDSKGLSTLLANNLLSSPIGVEIEFPKKLGANKYSIAKLLSESLKLKENPRHYYDTGLWTWMAANLLELLAPQKRGSNEREFRERALYILENKKWTKYYRHLLSFPCWIYAELGEKGRIFLRGDISERGDVVEQLAAVRDIQRNTRIVEAATLLYYERKTDSIAKGAASKGLPGTARRFRDVIQQLGMTFDLNAMTGDQIVGILPQEFDKWRSGQKRSTTI